MYLAMARVAHREGYPEIGLYWEKAAHEEAEHAAKFAELLGEVITDSTKKNLEMRVDAENGATDGKFQLAKLAKQYNLDAIHDTVCLTKPGTGPFYTYAAEHFPVHAACPVIAGITKCAEAECDLALRQDAGIFFEE